VKILESREKTEQQTFYKKAKEDEEIKEEEGRNHLVAN